MKKALLILVIFSICISCKDHLKKNDKYKSVTIGSQVWMESNLDVDHYRNGDPIPEVKNPEEWSKLTTGAWCYYFNDPINGVKYGKLYNWFAVNDPRGLAPKGWHIPNNSEWDELISFLGGDIVAGGKLKQSDTSNWHSPNLGATNISGFSALPGGDRFVNGTFSEIGFNGSWWLSTVRNSQYASSRRVAAFSQEVSNFFGSKENGYSVRCIKDK